MKFHRYRSHIYENQDDIKRCIGNNRECDHVFDCDDHPYYEECPRCYCTNIISDTGQNLTWGNFKFLDYCKDHIKLCFNCRSTKIEIWDEIEKVDYCNECWQNKILISDQNQKKIKPVTKDN